MNEDCVFCKIFRGDIPVEEVSRTSDALVFRDVKPQAPHHLLAIPKRHAADLSEFVAAADSREVGDLFALAARTGQTESPGGYRLVVNTGADGGQTVFHLHVHILGGRQLRWPPG